MNNHFTHLHLHTEYSLLDGAISIEKLVEFGVQQQFKALAITDHGNVFGAVKFFQQCKKVGIKPILGMEAYLTEDATQRDAKKKYYHLILLVQNEIGYRNLCKLISFSYQKGFYFKPRIDYTMLEQHAQGLIVTTACLGGHIPTLLQNGDMNAVHTQLDWFLTVFGEHRFYLEVQPEDQKAQKELNQALYTLSIERGIPLIATGDCHYVAKEDREAHEVMLAIQTHDRMDNAQRYTFGDCRVYMRTLDEMLTIFTGYPEAIWNSGVIADMCNFEFQTNKLHFPTFPIPVGYATAASFFSFKCQEGLNRLFADGFIADILLYQKRLNEEIDLIVKMGFVEYFLIVSDFIQWAYKNQIPVGPGRGSAAGSLVSWALQITNIDPLKYNLLFERFLNPERVSMPDIDIDFCIEGRDRVINYVRDTYGHDKVCHIITFGTMLAKGVVKDVARALGFSFEDSQTITDMIPDQLKITLREALEQEPKLREMVNANPRVNKLFEIAFKLEGLTRHASKHAAGIVICPQAVDEVLPVYIPPKSTELVAQYAMTELESIGFLKIDFLGLKNLTLIDRTLKLIYQLHAMSIDINKIPLDDSKTFTLLCAGNSSGVFQLESEGIKEVLRKLQPSVFEDIIAVNALYRPGPLGSGMVDDFIERKHGRQKIEYLFPELEPILQETYGVIVYQEQVIKIASVIGGYSLGEADILRRAMGKKKVEVMQEQRAIFVKKSQERGFNEKNAQELFDLMAYFAGYGFNKSHSAAYALIAYQTAYLKANYIAEFMACLLSLEVDHAEKLAFYLQEAKQLCVSILPPNINRSLINFSVSGGAILFGLQGIKNVGLVSLEDIITERNKHGSFVDLLDFCMRVDLRTSNKRVLEKLICAGAFDTLPGSRAQKFNELGLIIDRAIAYKKDRATGQMGLFGNHSAVENEVKSGYQFESNTQWTNKEILEKELEAIGFYITAHPLEQYQRIIARFTTERFATILKHMQTGVAITGDVVICGILKKKREITTKNGDKMAFLQLEDMENNAEIILFPKVYAKTTQWLEGQQIFIVHGALDVTNTQILKIKAHSCIPIELVFREWQALKGVSVVVPDKQTEHMLKALDAATSHDGIPLDLLLEENNTHIRIRSKKRLTTDTKILETLERDYNLTIHYYT
jgi:DNA polymerase III subunit alpha